MSCSKAFTLIELLVVISIIAVLAALLYPVLSSSKELSKETMCSSNLHQLAVAVELYRADYSGATVGEMDQMGLPPQPILQTLPLANSFRGICQGPDKPQGLSPDGFPYRYTVPNPGEKTGETLWSDYVAQVGDQAVLFMDTNHNPAGTPIEDELITKTVLASCLDGHAMRKRKQGDPWSFISFWQP